MKILFVNPRFPESLWDFRGCADITGKAYAHPPLSLPTLAALTPGEHSLEIVDENIEPLSVGREWTLVAITSYFIQRERAFEIADRFRSLGVFVAIGGPLVEASTLRECASHADALFVGEAELTWPLFIRDFENGAARPVYRQSDLVDMHQSPTPRFDLLKLDRYTTATIETSRGCPYSCEFCEIPTRLGKRSRTKTASQVMAEIGALRRLGADSVFVVDDHFVGDRRRARALLKLLADDSRANAHDIYYSCQFTINLASDDQLLDELREANVRRVFIGLETPREAGLRETRKRQNVTADAALNVRALHAHGIVVWAGLIVGFDADDAAIFDEQLEFVQQLAIPVAMIGLLQAIPGTPLHGRLESSGRLREVPMSGVRGTAASMLATNIVHPTMSQADLARGYQRLITEMYEPERFGDRLVSALTSAGQPAYKSHRLPGREELGMLARLCRHYAIRAEPAERRMFARVLWRVARHPTADLTAALMHLAVYKHVRSFYRQLATLRPSAPAPAPAPASRSPAIT